MNKIYRVVWNETTQTWNAVAEFAKAHGKTASSGIGGIVASVGVRFAFTAIMSGLLLASGQVMAAANNGKTLANGKAVTAAAEGADYNTCYFDTTSYNVVCGDDTTTALDFIPQDGGQPPKQGKSVSIGQGTQTQGESNVAIGPNSATAETGSIAIGSSANAAKNQTIAIGQGAATKGQADIAIGKGAGPGSSSANGRNIAIGENALQNSTNSDNVIAIGTNAGAGSDSTQSIFIGNGANGMDTKNVAIGNLSKTKGGSIAVGDSSNAQGSSSVAIGTSAATTGVAANGVAIGFNSTASGLSAVAIGGASSTGKGANASGPASLAIMGTAVASAQRAISIGEFTVGSGAYGIAIGGKANAQGTSSIAIGGSQAADKGPTATGNFSTAIGYGAKAGNSDAVAIGSTANAALKDTTAVGKNSTANGLRATAFGVDSNAGAENALAAGPQTTASAKGAIAVGFATQATGLSSVAVGKEAIATKETSTSLGQNSQATANNAVAIGNKAVAAGTGNIVVGTNAGVYDPTVSAGRTVGADTVYIGADSGRNAYTNERQISIGKGTGNNATGVDNIALGLRSGAYVVGANNVAIGKEAGMGTDAQKLNVTSTVAIGEAAKGSFNNTVAVGRTALAEKESAIAVGMVSKASGDNSVAIGKTANASAHETVAIGHETVAGAVSSVAVGQRANASGSEAVALGIDSNASGRFAVAIGNMAKVTDSKLNGVAIGSNAVASDDYAMAMGLDTQATGNSSIAFGNTAKALGKEAIAFGHLATAAKNNTLALGVSANSAEVGAVTLGAYTKADAVTGTALGYSAHAVNENDVALGGDTLTEAHHNGDYTLNGNYTAAGTWSRGTVSVGKVDAATPANSFTRQIQNVSAGVISATSTDAINGSQLYATNSYLLNLGNNVKNALGGETAIDNAGNLTLNNLGGTGKANVHDAIAAVKETAEKGWNLKANEETSSEKIAAGDTVTFKEGKNIKVSRDGKNITVATSDDVSFNKVTVGDSVLTDNGLTVGNGTAGNPVSLTKDGLNNGGNKISNVAAGEADTDAVNVAQLKANSGRVESGNNNIVVETDKTGGSNVYKVSTAKDLKADSLTAGETVVNNSGVKVGDKVALGKDGLKAGDVNITTDGINAGNKAISNVTKGVKSTDAVNVAQLNEQLAATEKTTTVVAGKNVTVSEKVDGNNTEYTVNADKTTLSQAAGGAVKVSEGAKDADGVTDYALDLTDEAKADIAKGVAAKDAVDNKGLTFAADNGTTGAKKLGDSLSVKGDGNILTRADENGIGFSLADKITVGKAGNGNKPLVIDGTAGLISGLSNTTLGGADFATKGQAASEEQLNAAQANLAKILGGNAANNNGNVTFTDIGGTGKANVHDAIAAVKETADKGWNLKANDETSSEKIGAGDTVSFKEGKNVKVSRNGKNITVATSDDVSFDKVTVGGSVLTDNGLTVGNGKAGKPVSLTKDGLNNGGNKVSDIAAGEADTDAVNVAQLKAAAAKATSKVDSGNDNIVVTPEQNADGSTTYKVATAPNLKADSFTAGDTVVNNDGVKVGDKVALGKDGLKAGDVNITADGINAGNKAISNVAAGVKDTDAANVGQLNRLTAAAKTEVEAGTNIASVTSKQGANGQTVYTVNADGASVSAGSDNIVVTKGNKDANNVTDYAVDLSKAVKADIAKGVAAKDAVDNKGISFAGDSGTTIANKLGDTVAVKGDANITTTAGANGIQVGLNKDLKVDSVKAGDTVVNNNGVNVGDKVALGKDGLKAGDVNITADGINAGGKKVTGVAAGTVAAGSTDAVNGGQLHQVYELIGSNGGNVNTAPPAVEADGKAGLGNIKNITLVDNSNNPNVTNVTNETKIAQSNGYSLVTYNVEDQGMYVTNNVIEAVGRMNEQGIKFFHTNDGEVNPDVQAYNGEDSSASGAYATAVGYQAASKGTNAIAIGKGAKANAENTIAIGTGNIVSGKNSGAIGDPTVVSGNSAYSIGNNNNVSADNAYALGSNIKATVNDSVYLGDRAQTQGIHTADAAKGEAYTYGGLNDKAVAGKAGSAAAANKVAGVVTVGNGTDETRQVQGVAAGVVSADSTDAINGSQLYYTNQAINQSVINIGNYVVNMGDQINQRIDNVESDSKAGTAAAMAVAGLPQAYLPGKSMMAVAGGVYRGESGYAVGFSSISDGGNWVIKGTATGNSRGHYGATAGVGYQW